MRARRAQKVIAKAMSFVFAGDVLVAVVTRWSLVRSYEYSVQECGLRHRLLVAQRHERHAEPVLAGGDTARRLVRVRVRVRVGVGVGVSEAEAEAEGRRRCRPPPASRATGRRRHRRPCAAPCLVGVRVRVGVGVGG